MGALQRIAERFPGIVTLISTNRNIERATAYADVVVGAVLVPGQRSPILVSREMVRAMKPRSVIIDVSIDEGGCVETSRPTTHEYPTYVEEGVIHCCVPNLPGVVARTSTHAFVNAAMPYILEIAGRGVDLAMQESSAVRSGVVTFQGEFHQMRRFSAYEEVDDGLD
jgi:alanine dehydrogenase